MFKITTRGERMGQNWYRKQKEEAPGCWDSRLGLTHGSPELSSASSWEVHPYGGHGKKQTPGADEITETKILDTGNRFAELTAKQQILYFCSRGLTRSHRQTVPSSSWREGPELEIKSHSRVLLYLLIWKEFPIFRRVAKITQSFPMCLSWSFPQCSHLL